MTATISLKKFDKLEQQVKASLNFMMTLCVKCSSGPTIFRVSEIIRNKDSNLPRLIMQALEDLGYIKCEGTLTGKKYHWVKTTPTEEQAQAVVDKARQADIEYKRNYIAEKSGYKETLRTGPRTFIRVLDNKDATKKPEPAKYPTTPTEIHIESMLNKMHAALSSREIMDFDAYCQAKMIPLPIQYAVISLGLITKQKGRGYKFALSKANYETIRNVIEKRREYVVDVTVMPVVIETSAQPAPSIEVKTVVETKPAVIANPAQPVVAKVEEKAVSLDKDFSNERKTALAEMFAKVGKYDMAEKLLQEVLN